jgi:hypothetical protein
MFIVEAIPAVLLAFVVLAMMTDRPALATWLAPEEKAWLETRLQDERRRIESAGHLSLARALMDRRVLALSAIYFTIVTATYGITFFLPQIVKGIGLSNVMTGLVTAIPYTVGTMQLLRELVPGAKHVAVLVNPTDRSNESTLRDVEAAAVGQQVLAFEATAGREIDAAFASLEREKVDALFVSGGAFFAASVMSSFDMNSSARLHT